MIKAEIVGHSLSPQNDELISVLATFPRIILAEVNTHRMLSKNTSSSRAIPFNKMLEAIQNDPFIPIAWQKDHKGMQGNEYHTNQSIDLSNIELNWLKARDVAIQQAELLNKHDVTKQLCNRLLEPFMWTTMLITGPKSGWDNFFNLRCPIYDISASNSKGTFKSWKDVLKHSEKYHTKEEQEYIINCSEIDKLRLNKGQAEIHMMALAESIWDAVNESTPRKLKAGEWHVPFVDSFENYSNVNADNIDKLVKDFQLNDIKISVAMAARTSYTVVGEEKEINYKNLIGLYDRLLTQDPPHSSPFEHCARTMSDEEYFTAVKTVKGLNREKAIVQKDLGWCNNLKGFIPYRYFVDNGLVI